MRNVAEGVPKSLKQILIDQGVPLGPNADPRCHGCYAFRGKGCILGEEVITAGDKENGPVDKLIGIHELTTNPDYLDSIASCLYGPHITVALELWRNQFKPAPKKKQSTS